MERNDVIKALERCTSSVRSCLDCPRELSYGGCFRKVMINSLALIRELTEEKDREKRCLTVTLDEEQVDEIMSMCRKSMELDIKAFQQDTIQKYGEKVYQFIIGFDKEKLSDQDKDYIIVRLAQIAKELVGGEQE